MLTTCMCDEGWTGKCAKLRAHAEHKRYSSIIAIRAFLIELKISRKYARPFQGGTAPRSTCVPREMTHLPLDKSRKSRYECTYQHADRHVSREVVISLHESTRGEAIDALLIETRVNALNAQFSASF